MFVVGLFGKAIKVSFLALVDGKNCLHQPEAGRHPGMDVFGLLKKHLHILLVIPSFKSNSLEFCCSSNHQDNLNAGQIGRATKSNTLM